MMKRGDKMKVLKIIGLGVAIWGLSLFWPDLNLGLTPLVMMKLVLGFGLVSLAYLLGQYLSQSEQITVPVEVAVPTRPWLGLDNKDERSWK
jgi:hypothetical protein